jgi:hypothetical protein
MSTTDFVDAAKLAVAGIITYLPLVLAAIFILVVGIFLASWSGASSSRCWTSCGSTRP